MADDYKSRGWPLHVLLNNAGIQAPTGHRGQKTPGGFEVRKQFPVVLVSCSVLSGLITVELAGAGCNDVTCQQYAAW